MERRTINCKKTKCIVAGKRDSPKSELQTEDFKNKYGALCVVVTQLYFV